MENAVFSRSSGANSTCQYPVAMSSVVNHLALARVSSESSIRGRGMAKPFVTLFTALRSTQNRKVPSFLRTKTTGEHHGLSLSSMMPSCNIFSFCFSTWSRTFTGTRRGRCFIGMASPVSILCLAKLV